MTEVGPKYDCSHENEEKILVDKYLPANSSVLELGARYGIASCAISKKQGGSGKLVSVDPDPKVAAANAMNKIGKKCNYKFETGAISVQPLELHENFIPLGETTSEKGGAGRPYALRIPTKQLSVKGLEEKHGLKFDTIVADCESCFIKFVEENPQILPNLNMAIFEVDYKNKEQSYD